jgi:predicted transcriptional regulator
MINTEKLLQTIKDKKSTIPELATAIGMDKSTLYRKINEDVSCGITVKEANNIVNFLGLTKDEANSIFFAPDVA